MNSKLLMVILCMLLSVVSLASSTSSREITELRTLAVIIEIYLRDHAASPVDLNDLKDYDDLSELLRDGHRADASFTNRYGFLSSMPWVQLPGEAQRQIVLLGLAPSLDGKRAAIWRDLDGECNAGMIDEKQLQMGIKDFDLSGLKAMGGEIPVPAHPRADGPVTKYQSQILQLEREGKITPQPRNPNGKKPQGAASPSSLSTNTVSHTPPPEMVAPRTTIVPLPVISVPTLKKPVWIWVIGVLATAVAASLIWKRFQ